MQHNQRVSITQYKEIVKLYAIEALLNAHEQRGSLQLSLKKREPTGYPNFNIASVRVALYWEPLRRSGTRWIGL